MEPEVRDESAPQLIDAADRAYVESLSPGAEREKVIASLTRYRAPEALRAGDMLPELTVRRVKDLAATEIGDLVQGRPLLLVFGSFT